MSPFKVNIAARNPKDESRETPPIEALVDTGSELTWLPADVLRQAGITPPEADLRDRDSTDHHARRWLGDPRF
jgi:hypothetical protein